MAKNDDHFNFFHILDLADGTSLYSCGRKLDVSQNGRLCSNFKLEKSPRDVLTSYLNKLVKGKVEPNGNFTYCRCRGQRCNGNTKHSISCFSTPSIDRKTESFYEIPLLRANNFFSDENLLHCPPGIKQCYYYGKDSIYIM